MRLDQGKLPRVSVEKGNLIRTWSEGSFLYTVIISAFEEDPLRW